MNSNHKRNNHKRKYQRKSKINFDPNYEVTPQLRSFIKQLTIKHIVSYTAMFILAALAFILISGLVQLLSVSVPELSSSIENYKAVILGGILILGFTFVIIFAEFFLIYFYARLYDFVCKSFSKRIVNTYCAFVFIVNASLYGNDVINIVFNKYL